MPRRPRKTLAEAFPELAKQWHPTKNGDLTPDDVTPGSSKRVWSRCPKGPDHEWKAAVSLRALRAVGCPFCRGLRVPVTNSLAARFPDVAAQRHPTNSGDLTPSEVVAVLNDNENSP